MMQKLFYFIGIIFFVIGSIVGLKLYVALDYYEENQEKIDTILNSADQATEKLNSITSGQVITLIERTNATLEQTTKTLEYVNQNVEKINGYLSGHYEKIDQIITIVKSVYDVSTNIKDGVSGFKNIDIDWSKYSKILLDKGIDIVSGEKEE